MKRFAFVVSFLFNPLILAYLVPFLIAYHYTSSGWYALKWVLFTSLFVIGGLSYLLYGRMKGYFSDFDISIQKERPKFYKHIIPLGLLYLIISVFLKGFTFPMSIFAFGVSLGLIVYTIVNNFIKASGHVGVACAFVIVLGMLYGVEYFLGLVWLVPLLAWSRLTLKRHTLSEVIIGGMLGSTITLLTFIIGKKLYFP